MARPAGNFDPLIEVCARVVVRDLDGGNDVAGAAAPGDAYPFVVVVSGFIGGDHNIAHCISDTRPSAYSDSIPVGRVVGAVALRLIFSDDDVVRIIVGARTSRNRDAETFAAIVRITREISSPRL